MRNTNLLFHHFVQLIATIGLLVCVALCCVSGSGCCCCGYHIGPSELYRSDIKTVFVQMVEADTYREAFGERLTEAICKKITEQTPYRLATIDTADTILAVKLTSENQAVSAYNRYDDTRQKDIKLVANASWTYRPQNDESSNGIRTEGVALSTQSYLVPEMGQSTATAQQEAIDKLAAEIVGLMEASW